MNIKNSCLFLCAVLMIACGKLPDTTGGPEIEVAYIQEFIKSPHARFTVDDEGGYADITPRLSNPVGTETSITIEVDPTAVDAYNEINKTSFKILPEANYDLQLINEDGSVASEGKRLSITLAPYEYGKKVRLAVKSMKTKIKGEGGEITEELLPSFQNYALPLRMVDAGTMPLQEKGSTGMFFLDRKFHLPVAHISGDALRMMYPENKIKPGTSEELDHDCGLTYPEWTYQYTFRADRLVGNDGMFYPSGRVEGADLYVTLYGGQMTLFTGNGKEQFNQPSFKGFTFKEKTWYNIAATFSYQNEVPEYSVYVNGKLAYQSIWPHHVNKFPIFSMGNQSFRGHVREIRIWSRVLTEGEINETIWFANPSSPGLELYLPLTKDIRNIAEGKPDWVDVSPGATIIHFDDSFGFPIEE